MQQGSAYYAGPFSLFPVYAFICKDMKHDNTDLEKLYHDYIEGRHQSSSPEDFDLLAKAIRDHATEEEKRERWEDFGRLAYDGHDVPLLFDLLSLVENEESGSFEWNFLMAMALYRSAVVINMADDVIFDDICTNVRETLRSARMYSAKAQAIRADGELERLDGVISRALTVARLKGVV